MKLKKTLVMVLAACLLVGVLAGTAFADAPDGPDGGSSLPIASSIVKPGATVYQISLSDGTTGTDVTAFRPGGRREKTYAQESGRAALHAAPDSLCHAVLHFSFPGRGDDRADFPVQPDVYGVCPEPERTAGKLLPLPG